MGSRNFVHFSNLCQRIEVFCASSFQRFFGNVLSIYINSNFQLPWLFLHPNYLLNTVISDTRPIEPGCLFLDSGNRFERQDDKRQIKPLNKSVVRICNHPRTSSKPILEERIRRKSSKYNLEQNGHHLESYKQFILILRLFLNS